MQKQQSCFTGRKNVNLNNALAACRFKEVKIYYRHLRFQQNQQKSQQKKRQTGSGCGHIALQQNYNKTPNKRVNAARLLGRETECKTGNAMIQ